MPLAISTSFRFCQKIQGFTPLVLLLDRAEGDVADFHVRGRCGDVEDLSGHVCGREHLQGGFHGGEFLLPAFEVVIDERGFDEAGGDGGHLVGRVREFEFIAEGFGDPSDRELSGGIEATGGRHAMAGEGGDIDDTSARGRETFEGLLGTMNESPHIDLPHFVHLGGVAVNEGGEVGAAGIVDEEVEVVGGVIDDFESMSDAFRIAEVARDREGSIGELANAAAEAKDGHSAGDEGLRDRESDAAGGSSDEGDFAGKGAHGD